MPVTGPGPSRWFRRGRRAPVPSADPAPAVRGDNDTIVIVSATDFVSCTYKGCGTLRPLMDASENHPCAGCGRV
ncbi:hypothetical protein [Frankia sp. CIT1]|uniref:hypothetical protein n=1 Tax=Frankia sp. CiP3 TaxID=2880971 RepID=UPI001EF4EE80